MSRDQFDLFKNLLEDYHQRIEKSHMAQAEVTSRAWGELKEQLEWSRSVETRVNAATQLLEEHIKEENQMIDSIANTQKQILEKLEPIHKVYSDGAGTLRVLKWLGGILIGVGAVIASVKGLFFK